MPAAYKFIPRTNQLLSLVGDGTIMARVVVDQVYAEFQHERTDLRHPGGGGAHYLRDPLFKGVNGYFRKIAREYQRRGMPKIFVDIADDLSYKVAEEAPEFMGDLRASGQPMVKDRGRYVYRGTHAPRLTKRYAEAKSDLWHSIYGGRR